MENSKHGHPSDLDLPFSPCYECDRDYFCLPSSRSPTFLFGFPVGPFAPEKSAPSSPYLTLVLDLMANSMLGSFSPCCEYDQELRRDADLANCHRSARSQCWFQPVGP